MRHIILILLAVFLCLTGCSAEEPAMTLKIGETEVPVIWEDNPSVEALKEFLPLTVQMSMYGGFEQVGPIGQEIVSYDEQTKTEPGDIVLYSGDQIVIFYGGVKAKYGMICE